MASSTTSLRLSISSSSTLNDGRTTGAVASPQCVSLPTLPPPTMSSQNRLQTWKTTTYCRKLARNVVAMATGDAPAEAAETPEIVKTILEAWDNVEDKYAVSSLAVAGVVALWGSAGMISAIDRLPLIPGVFELVGIGYSGWFAYKNLVFKPDRQALFQKIKETYKDVIGKS
ncbi:hypothetical protein MKW98_014748 [Papaver atlanticum]|uniref:Cyanobacterial aminoacyl-tRNA synthetase CAAD domain-containing protein n=1 Tax=Papaver atlanticum TaxID=357466 RepID=A0AAD4SFE2_9MAGN|nr:hypothetical protein MKW98_014748 [Papaver atlanticum]